jgi:hypothetical protein
MTQLNILKESLPKHAKGYNPKHKLNADETGVFFSVFLRKHFL